MLAEQIKSNNMLHSCVHVRTRKQTDLYNTAATHCLRLQNAFVEHLKGFVVTMVNKQPVAVRYTLYNTEDIQFAAGWVGGQLEGDSKSSSIGGVEGMHSIKFLW